MMKYKKYCRLAALALAVLMALSLAACGGNGSGNQPQSGGQAGGSIDHSDLFGSWASEDMVLSFLEDFPGAAFMTYVDHPDEVHVYGFTIEGNSVNMELEPDQYNEYVTNPPAQMKLTMKSGQLVYGNAVFYTASIDLDGTSEQPAASEPAASQTEPAVTDPPAASTGITGIWWDGPSVLVFHNDYALSYVFGSGDDGDLRFGYLKHLYDCSYTLTGNTLSLSGYEMDGTLVNSVEVTLDGNTLSNEHGSMVKVSNNTGTEGELNGIWHCMHDGFQFGAMKGTRMEFYSDGSFRICQEEGSGQNGGTYTLTSQYDLPAVTLYDQNGNVIGTYCYEFLENDLLMIYVYDVDFGGYAFYRAS